ncbi:MAG: AAA family ATPase [Gemmatimonadetes bacterium]|nr:AAA family ATPase [Gemmatimonadota bacterium]
MTLTAFSIANFKAFSATQRVPLRPITLIYGANSAGKSSVIHALALAHHSIETGNLDTQRTQIGGESIDLGGFRQYVHQRGRDRSLRVELGFELDPGRLSGRVAGLLQSTGDIVVELVIGMGGQEERVRVERFTLKIDGVLLLSMSVRASGLLRLDRLDHSHTVFRELLILEMDDHGIHEEHHAASINMLDELVPGITARSRGLFPRVEEESEGSEVEGEDGENSVAVSRRLRREDLVRAALLGALRELMGGLGTALEDDIRRLRYLGPLRSFPPRHVAFSQHGDPNWFAGGGYAWDVVRTHEDVRQRVNAWLGDANRLKTPYELEVRDLLPAAVVSKELPAKLHKALHDLVASLLKGMKSDEMTGLMQLADQVAEQIAELDPRNQDYIIPEIGNLVAAESDDEELAESWTEEMVKERIEVFQDLVLIDKRTNTPVSHRDVGIGVSQVLPVLVSAYASKNKLLAIEQPEIHLHPALQAELGDVFLESALGGDGNTFLIETHSEHLLLRILRRIRETTDGELPQGVSDVHPEHVAVLYVQPGREDTEVLHIPVTADGEFERPWPNGFFAERAEELF